MFNLFNKSAEAHLNDANKGVNKFIAKFKKAAEAAAKEAISLETKLAAKIDKYDGKVEAAYSKYMGVEAKYTEKTSKAETEAAARQATLKAVAEQAQKAITNHSNIYLS